MRFGRPHSLVIVHRTLPGEIVLLSIAFKTDLSD